MKIRSIRAHLLKWLTIPLILISFLAFIIIFLLLSRNVNQHFDNSLLVAEKGLEERLYVKDGVLRFGLPHFGIDIQSSSGKGSIFYSVEDGNKKILTGHEDIPKPKSKTQKSKFFYNTTYLGAEIRALYVEYELFRNGMVYNATIIIAETLEDRKELVSDILFMTVSITFFIVIIAIVASVFSVKKGIEPLIDLQYSIKQRDMHDLTPIRGNVPQEVDSLVDSINKLFVKLKKSFLHVEKFNADVSHQLRTPLAELKVLFQTDKLLENSPRKTQYLDIIDGMAHTTEQLLLWAKTNPDAFDRNWFQPMNLSELCAKVAKEKVPFIHRSGFEFTYDVRENLWINGGPIILEGMINNLINNAINYAIDENKKPLGTITLSLKKQDDVIILCVIDEGFGIPEEHLLRVFDRFFRLDSRKPGSGLGLGIVKQIAGLHDASVEVSNKEPQGLKVSIVFKSY